MIFHETKLSGVYRIEPEQVHDDRGFFARTWCAVEFKEHGLRCDLTQCSISFNRTAGTLRGMHYQVAPHTEAKLVRVTSGAVLDVALDLRTDSATYGQWISAELSASNRHMLFIPECVAHGFQTLTDNTEVFYQIAGEYHPPSARGVRWNDPAFQIAWPQDPTVISDRDRDYPSVFRD